MLYRLFDSDFINKRNNQEHAAINKKPPQEPHHPQGTMLALFDPFKQNRPDFRIGKYRRRAIDGKPGNKRFEIHYKRQTA